MQQQRFSQEALEQLVDVVEVFDKRKEDSTH
jgi:hypothetical protein